MRKYILLFLLVGMSLGFTSCIDLIEEVTINKDLSGHFEMRLETGSFGGLNFGGMPEITQLRELDAKMNQLKSQPGISNVKKNIKPKDLKFNISFDFKDENSLNQAMYAMADIKPNIFIKKFLKIKKNKVIRPNLGPYLKKFIDDQKLLDQLPSADMLNYVNYKFIVNTPEEIKSLTGEKAMVQSNKKTVISTYSFKDLIINKENVYLKVKL